MSEGVPNPTGFGRPDHSFWFTMKKRLQVYYSGMVQGVGFRFTAERVARSLGLAGWVKNVPNGSVEAICEGEEAALIDFLQKMKSGPMKNYIRDHQVSWLEPTGESADFSVRF